MLKRKISKIIALAMVMGVAASAAPAMTARADVNVKVEASDWSNAEREEFEYARQEIIEAIGLLDNADLSNRDNYDRMIAFATAAYDRLAGLGECVQVDNLYELYDEIIEGSEYAYPAMLSILEIESSIAQGNLEYAKEMINYLNGYYISFHETYELNEATLRGIYDYLTQDKIVDIIYPQESETKEVEEASYDSAVLEQLTYAIEEMKIALDELDNGSNDFERIMTFAATSVERVRGLASEEIDKIPGGTGHYDWIEESYSEVLDTVTSNYNASYEQLNYAIEEMRIAVTELENGSKDFDRVMTFAATAVERVRPEMEQKGTMYKYWGAYYEDVSRLYGEVVETIASTPVLLAE